MVRCGTFIRCGVFLLLLVIAGCGQMPRWASPFTTPGTAGQFNFDWLIKGDKRVTPLQVFDDERRTWLQFAPDMAIPAVFARNGEEDTLLTYHRSGPYVVLPGVWSHLVIQGGHAQGNLYRQAGVPDETAIEVPEISDATAESAVSLVPSPAPAAPASVEPVSVESSFIQPVLVDPDPVADADQSVVADQPVAETFEVGPANGTMRETLVHWARLAQWDFGPEHWAVDVDIPIVGSAQFTTSFEEAVRALVASSELGDRPLQPCFYSNRVLRVVPFAQPCDRARTMASAS